jgi:hypothetical protein
MLVLEDSVVGMVEVGEVACLVTFAALTVDRAPFSGLPLIDETNGSQGLFLP